ncbi:MAG TPA: carboxypeptidase-like regulatory domain-containing protein [Pyrinomonadaceae bacterium]|nr:carboxypeptidase-like regulatory domain-containing protein [Pyrinomonadaceae bacterium]
MFKRSLFGSAIFAIVLTAFSAAAYGQLVVTSGKVELLGDDSSRKPVTNAIVDAYRSDTTKGSAQTGKTNGRGEFSFVGLLPGAEYALVVSGPGLSPFVAPGVKSGQDKLVITVRPGDGKRLTEAEVREKLKSAVSVGGGKPSDPSSGGSGELSEEDKKKKAAYDAEVAKITADNEKKVKANQIVAASLSAGNDAFNAGIASVKSSDFASAINSFSTAIAKYNEGYEANPDFAGSAPVLLNNKGTALRQRALSTYNKTVKETDATVKAEAFAAVTRDLLDSAEAYKLTIGVLATATPAEMPSGKTVDGMRLETYRAARDTFKLAVQTEKVDPKLIESAKAMLPEFLKAETDAAAKVEAQLISADLYRIAQDRESAIAAYKEVLVSSPDNLEAIGYLGLVLVDLSWLKDNDKTMAQDGANYLQRFVASAPDTHKLKEGAKGYLDILKTQSIIPVKSSGPAKKKP